MKVTFYSDILTRQNIFVFLMLFVLTLAQFRIIYRLEGGRKKIENFGYNEQNLLEGQTNIRAWISRSLAPALVWSFTELTRLPWHSSYIFLSVTLLCLINLVLFIFLTKFTTTYSAINYMLGFILIFLLLQHYYMFLWDYIDILVFTFFAFGILEQYPIKYFLVLFGISMFNRESSLFIAVYLFMQSYQYKPKLRLVSKKHLFTSIALIFINLTYLKTVRALFYNGPERKHVYNGIPALLGNENHLLFNIKYFFSNFYHFFNTFGPDFNITISIFIALLVCFDSICLKYGTIPLKKAAIILAIIIFSIFVSGLIMETRMWLITLPFVFLMHAYTHKLPPNHPIADWMYLKRFKTQHTY